MDQNQSSIQGLISDALRDTSDLARKEMALFRAELSENVRTLIIGVGMMVGAAVFAIAAIILFTEALVKWLATVVGSEALSALIVGGAMAVIAVGLVLYGRSTMSAASLMPNRAVRSIQRDTKVLSERVAG
ncbi:MAG TPA: phage holin family protein [Beijerinckiaceae bacterium]|nr:phage holin family protein [Beijerinckiaceae bacterium]